MKFFDTNSFLNMLEHTTIQISEAHSLGNLLSLVFLVSRPAMPRKHFSWIHCLNSHLYPHIEHTPFWWLFVNELSRSKSNIFLILTVKRTGANTALITNALDSPSPSRRRRSNSHILGNVLFSVFLISGPVVPRSISSTHSFWILINTYIDLNLTVNKNRVK